MAENTTPAKALKCFTRSVADHGIVHGDPNGHDDAKVVQVPDSKLAAWVADGLVQAPKGWKSPEVETPAGSDTTTEIAP